MNAAQLINQTSGTVEYRTDPRIVETAVKTMGSIQHESGLVSCALLESGWPPYRKAIEVKRSKIGDCQIGHLRDAFERAESVFGIDKFAEALFHCEAERWWVEAQSGTDSHSESLLPVKYESPFKMKLDARKMVECLGQFERDDVVQFFVDEDSTRLFMEKDDLLFVCMGIK